MLKIVKNRKWFYLISLAVIFPGLVALVLWKLPLGPDFVGGTLIEVKFSHLGANEAL